MEKISILAQLKVKNPTDPYGVVIIRGFYNRKPVASRSTGHRILTSHWDQDRRSVKPSAPNASLINTSIQGKLQHINAFIIKAEIAGQQPNRFIIEQAVKGLNASRDFIAFCRERIRADYNEKETIRTYLSECTKLESFRPEISFSDLNFLFLTNYKNYMLQVLNNDPNTVWKSFKFMNTMIRKAIKIGGIVQDNPFKDFDRGRYEQKRRNYLEIADCDRIEPLIMDDGQPIMIRRVALWFLFMCYSGMRFEDAMAFDPDLHVQDDRIIMTYQKSNSEVNNKMHDRLKRIYEMVKLFPLKMSNKEFNRWVKIVGTLAGIATPLTSHLGRHTLGGFLAEVEAPLETAQAILGHKDIRSTKVYFHQKSKTIDRGMEAINSL